MERRDWSLKALKKLVYIDSLDSFEKADALVRWNEEYLSDNSIEDIDLELKDLKILEELFYKNLNFLREHRSYTRKEIMNLNKMQEFLKNQ